MRAASPALRLNSTIHAGAVPNVSGYVNPFLAAAVLLSFAGAPPEALLRLTEARYNHAQTLKLDFSETYAGISHAPARTERGTLYLSKPGRMRWDYTAPAGKVFVSDGKQVFLYTPDQRRVERSRLKESDDTRAPLAFLLGKLDFSHEFEGFEARPEGADTWIVASPRNRNLDYTRVEFLIAPTGEILRLKVNLIGGGRQEFAFSHETLNLPVAPALFAFHPPAGAEVVEGDR